MSCFSCSFALFSISFIASSSLFLSCFAASNAIAAASLAASLPFVELLLLLLRLLLA
jgi:hypothetical protein